MTSTIIPVPEPLDQATPVHVKLNADPEETRISRASHPHLDLKNRQF